VPLFTLRPPPHDDARKTRGQDGSLLLSCAALPSATSCRFIPAHPYPPPRSRQNNRFQRDCCEVFHCRNKRSWVITTLSCLIPLAGFEVSLIGRFSGIPRGHHSQSRYAIDRLLWDGLTSLSDSAAVFGFDMQPPSSHRRPCERNLCKGNTGDLRCSPTDLFCQNPGDHFSQLRRSKGLLNIGGIR
jgi:hypothetical protein